MSRLCSTVSRMWFLLVRVACKAILTGLWHRFSNSLPWVCLSLFHLRGVVKPDQGLGSISLCKRDLCEGLVVHLELGGLTCRVGMRLIQVARSPLVAVSPPVLPILKGRMAVEISAHDVLPSSASSSSSSAVFQVGMFNFFDQLRSITSKRFVLIMVWGNHLQLRSHAPLSYNFQQFNVKVAAAHHHIIQKEWMSCFLREWLYHLLVVLVFILAYLWFLSILVVSCLYLTLSGLIIICIYLLLRCLLSDLCGSLFSMVIMPSPLIYRMLIYIFLLLSIIIISYNLFGTTYLISGNMYLLAWPQHLGFSQTSLNLFCSFAITRVSVLLSI